MAKAIIMIIVLNYNEIHIIIIQWFENMCKTNLLVQI